MEDNADGVPHARANTAHAVAKIDAIIPLCSSHRPVMYGKGNRVTLAQSHDLGPTLHAWSLFGQNEFAACKILGRFRKQDCGLNWKRETAV
jgi:hypothetical protein